MANGSKKSLAQNGNLSRRHVVLGGTAAVAAGIGLPGVAKAQTSAPFRIGCLNSFSKTFALLGQSNLNGMNLYLDKIGWQVAGRKIELIREDDEISPQAGLQKVRKLVESDKVDIVCGPQASNVALAILGYIKQNTTPLLITGAGLTALTWERVPHVFRSSLSTWQICNPMAGWIYERVAKEIVLSGSDFAGGRDVLNEFKMSYVKLGGRIVGEVYPPLGTTDFSPYLSTIRGSGASAIYNFYAGGDAVRFVKQFSDFGLKDKMRIAGFASLVDGDTVEAQGQSALGVLTSNIYAESLENASNKEFVEAYRKRYGDYPSLYSEYGYTAARVIVEALNKTSGDTGDRQKFLEAIKSVKFDAPRGPFRFDPVTHNAINDVYLFEAADDSGRIRNKVIATKKEVQDPGVKPN